MVNTELENIVKMVEEKVNADSTGVIESDKEFYYTAGQCISFMCDRYTKQFRSLNKNALSRQVMLSKNIEDLKIHLKMFFGKCSNVLYMEDKAFNNAYAMLIGYTTESNKIDKDYLQLGYLENCIL